VIHQLTPAECREVLSRASLGRLACCRRDQPYVVPVFVYFDEEWKSLFSFSTAGQKIRWMRQNPKVCVEVDEITGRSDWSTVLVFGRYQEIRGTPEEAAVRDRAREHFQRRHAWWLPAAAKLDTGKESHAPVVYRIRIDRITGRRAAQKGGGAPPGL